MKLVCVRNTVTKNKGIPLINRAKVTEKIDGITLGNKYEVMMFHNVHGTSTNMGGRVDTDVRFLVYNDNKTWETYHPDCFAPESEE